jgi:hypothetical protein
MSLFGWFGAFLHSRNSLAFEIVAFSSADQRAQTQESSAEIERVGSGVLGFSATRLVPAGGVLMVVKPQTVVRWHRAGFRLYWRLLSRRKEMGRPRISSELRELIERMAKENPTWAAPRIHGELLKLGFEVSERTLSRYLARVGRNRDDRRLWLIFPKNHREVIAAMDFFTVPTATFRVLYCFFVISRSRRRILHFNATEHPTSPWIVHQMREAFPEDTAPQYLILDRDSKYEGEATEMLKSLGSKLIRTAYQSPWQNGVAEGWVGSCRREVLQRPRGDKQAVFIGVQRQGPAVALQPALERSQVLLRRIVLRKTPADATRRVVDQGDQLQLRPAFF